MSQESGGVLVGGAAFKGHEGATTGRAAINALTFAQLRGYDEEGLHGSGYQDVDMATRARSLCARQRGQEFKAVYGKTVAESHRLVGYPVPNDFESKQRDRNSAKIYPHRSMQSPML